MKSKLHIFLLDPNSVRNTHAEWLSVRLKGRLSIIKMDQVLIQEASLSELEQLASGKGLPSRRIVFIWKKVLYRELMRGSDIFIHFQTFCNTEVAQAMLKEVRSLGHQTVVVKVETDELDDQLYQMKEAVTGCEQSISTIRKPECLNPFFVFKEILALLPLSAY